MTQKQLVKTRIKGGVWEGIFSGGDGQPKLEAMLLGVAVPGVTVSPIASDWAVRVPIPADALTEGVQTFLIREMGSDEALAHFTVITGVAADDDLLAEVDLLRQELDMLKRAFRRHCLETLG